MATNIMHLPRDFRDAFLGLLHFRFFSWKENYDAFQASFVIFACTSMKDDEIISRIALQLEDFKVRNHCFRHNRKAVEEAEEKVGIFPVPLLFLGNP